jgi:DNA-binding NarL/FixJ family response regulator
MTNGQELVVLLVDDSTLILDKIISILRDIKNIGRVVRASNADQALALIEATIPDIVLMDIFLGDRIDLSLLPFMKQAYPTIEIVILTNYSQGPYRDTCKRLGAHHFLDKSNDFDLIPMIINGTRPDK